MNAGLTYDNLINKGSISFDAAKVTVTTKEQVLRHTALIRSIRASHDTILMQFPQVIPRKCNVVKFAQVLIGIRPNVLRIVSGSTKAIGAVVHKTATSLR